MYTTIKPSIEGLWIHPSITMDPMGNGAEQERAMLILMDFFYWGVKAREQECKGIQKVTIGPQMFIM